MLKLIKKAKKSSSITGIERNQNMKTNLVAVVEKSSKATFIPFQTFKIVTNLHKMMGKGPIMALKLKIKPGTEYLKTIWSMA